MSNSPLISLILCVKNGMPYLPEAVTSVAAQTYPDYELIVQDGGSSDGTLEFLRGLKTIPNIQIESAPDSGIGQAYNRAVHRCNGEIIGSIDADNLLEAAALAVAVETMESQPGCAAIYGASKIMDSEGQVLKLFEPGPFDLLRLMKCDLVPPFGQSFFKRSVCGEQLRFDERLKTCADFDLWLRLSHLPIVMTPRVVGSTRISEMSMTCRVEDYAQFCNDKIAALNRYLARYEGFPLVDVVYRLSVAGIYSWAANSTLALKGGTKTAEEFFEKAAGLDPSSEQLRSLAGLFARHAATKDICDRRPLFASLQQDLNRNLTSNGKASFTSKLRIMAKLLLGRYPENGEADNLNHEP